MVTDNQVRRLRMLIKKEKTRVLAASKAGMDEKTARKYIRLGKLPSECKSEHRWRTRPDPFFGEWNKIEQMLDINPGLEAKTIFEDLQRKRPGKYLDGQLRTLQRRVKVWRGTKGPAKEVFFSQVHHPGKICASDFTNMSKLGITIAGEWFNHLLYHFVLTYSNWETGTICFSENFESLSEGLQNALWELGGIPQKHRTDRLSSAVNKDCSEQEFTQRYQGLLDHYGLVAEKIQTGQAHENGDIEQRHYRFKKAVEQSLMLRDSKDFSDRKEYEEFIRKIFNQLNAGRSKKFAEELKVLKPLPSIRLTDCAKEAVKVSRGSTIRVRHNTYSVPSRLIGVYVKVHIYAEKIQIWYSQKLIDTLPRLRGSEKHRIEYRHIIDWLVRKPGAFKNYRFREDLFPSSYFRMAYDYLREHSPSRAAKEYLEILYLAAKKGEQKVECAIRQLLFTSQSIGVKAVNTLVESGNKITLSAEVMVDAVDLAVYDELLGCKEEELAHA